MEKVMDFTEGSFLVKVILEIESIGDVDELYENYSFNGL